MLEILQINYEYLSNLYAENKIPFHCSHAVISNYVQYNGLFWKSVSYIDVWSPGCSPLLHN